MTSVKTGAISFIDTLDHTALSNITQQEFEAFVSFAPSFFIFSAYRCKLQISNVERAIQTLPPESARTPEIRHPPARGTTTPPSPRPDVDLTAESDAQAVVSGTTFPDATKAFFQRSSEVAQRTVSRPLNAISKILSELGEPEQHDEQPHSPSAANRSPSDTPPPPSTEYAPSYQPRRPRPRQRSQPSPSSSLSPPPQGAYPPNPNVEPGDYLPDNADVTASIARATEAQQKAALGTLKSMFPDIDEDVLEIVLLSSKGELPAAIDRLLDMS
jgi:hypothetical protein